MKNLSVDTRKIHVCAISNMSGDTICFTDTEHIHSIDLTGSNAVAPGKSGNTGDAPIPEYVVYGECGYINIYNSNNGSQIVYIWVQKINSQYHIFYDTVDPKDSTNPKQLDSCDGQESSLYGYWTLQITGDWSTSGYPLTASLIDMKELSAQANTAIKTTYIDQVTALCKALNDYCTVNDIKTLTKTVAAAKDNPGVPGNNVVTDMLNSPSFAGVNLSRKASDDSSSDASISIAGEMSAAVYFGFDVAAGVIIDLVTGNPYGLVSINATFGKQIGFSIGLQVGVWYFSPEELNGLGAGVTIGLSIPTEPPPPPEATAKTDGLVNITFAVSAAFGIVNGCPTIYGFSVSVGVSPPEPGSASIAGSVGYTFVI